MCFELEDSRYLLKNYDSNYDGDFDSVLEKMSNQIIDDFGVSNKYEALFNKKKSLIKLRLKYVTTGNERYLTDIQVRELEINKLNIQFDNKIDIKEVNSQNRHNLTKWQGFPAETMTVYDYYRAIKQYEKELRKNKR